MEYAILKSDANDRSSEVGFVLNFPALFGCLALSAAPRYQVSKVRLHFMTHVEWTAYNRLVFFSYIEYTDYSFIFLPNNNCMITLSA